MPCTAVRHHASPPAPSAPDIRRLQPAGGETEERGRVCQGAPGGVPGTTRLRPPPTVRLLLLFATPSRLHHHAAPPGPPPSSLPSNNPAARDTGRGHMPSQPACALHHRLLPRCKRGPTVGPPRPLPLQTPAPGSATDSPSPGPPIGPPCPRQSLPPPLLHLAQSKGTSSLLLLLAPPARALSYRPLPRCHQGLLMRTAL